MAQTRMNTYLYEYYYKTKTINPVMCFVCCARKVCWDGLKFAGSDYASATKQ